MSFDPAALVGARFGAPVNPLTLPVESGSTVELTRQNQESAKALASARRSTVELAAKESARLAALRASARESRAAARMSTVGKVLEIDCQVRLSGRGVGHGVCHHIETKTIRASAPRTVPIAQEAKALEIAQARAARLAKAQKKAKAKPVPVMSAALSRL